MIRMMYILPMLLGRTFDIKEGTVGIDIFSPEDVAKQRVNDESFSDSSFRTVESSSDVRDVLKIKGELSLNVKAGKFAVKGMGSYIKESSYAENSVEILTKVSYRTVSKSLPHDVKPVADWFTLGKKYLGTHYVQSIIYGGDLIASVRFKATKAEYLQDIRATVKMSLAAGNALDLVGEGKLEMVDKELKKKATMEISYYATVPLEGVPNNIKGFRELVRHFDQHVKKVNDGEGVAVEVELEELSSLGRRDFAYIKDTELESELEFFEEYFDDVIQTKKRLKSWVAEMPDTLTRDQKKEISKFGDRLSVILRKFIDTITNMDLEKGSTQLDGAREAYREGKGIGAAGKFRREMNRLMNKIVPPPDERNLGSSTYIHYGSGSCANDESTSVLYDGFVTSSPRNVTGAGYNYLCLPKKPEGSISGDYNPPKNGSLLAGVKYGLLENNPFDPLDFESDDSILRGIVCSACLVNERRTMVTFHGQNECPVENEWRIQYSGFLMSSNTDRSETICVDSKLESHQESYMGFYDQSLSFILLNQNSELTFVPCVVCAK